MPDLLLKTIDGVDHIVDHDDHEWRVLAVTRCTYNGHAALKIDVERDGATAIMYAAFPAYREVKRCPSTKRNDNARLKSKCKSTKPKSG